jgi:hypothetical protein
MLEKLLRLPLPDQLKAVVEKIESLDETSSHHDITEWVNRTPYLTRYERWVINRAFHKRDRAYMLNQAMEIVLGRDTHPNDILKSKFEPGEYRPRQRMQSAETRKKVEVVLREKIK